MIPVLLLTFLACEKKKECNIPITIVDFQKQEKEAVFTLKVGDTLKLLRNNIEVYTFIAKDVIELSLNYNKSDGKGCDSNFNYLSYKQDLYDNIHLKPLVIQIFRNYSKIFDVVLDGTKFQDGYTDTLLFNDTVNTQFAYYDNVITLKDSYSNKKLYFKSGYGIVKIIDEWGNIYERIP